MRATRVPIFEHHIENGLLGKTAEEGLGRIESAVFKILVHRRPAAAVIKIRAALTAQLNAPRDIRGDGAKLFRPTGCFERIGDDIANVKSPYFRLESPNNSGENVLKLPSTSTEMIPMAVV